MQKLGFTKEFTHYISMRFAGNFALYMQTAALTYMVYDLTNSKLALGLFGLSEVVPLILASLFSGSYVENNDKRNIILRGLTVLALITVVFMISTFLYYNGNIGLYGYLGVIYIGFAANGAARSFIGPASFSLLSRVVERKQYDKAIPIDTATFQIAMVTGPILGGVILAYFGILYCLIASLVLFVIGCISIYKVQNKPPLQIANSEESIWVTIKEGLHFVKNQPLILGVLTLDMFAVLLGGAEALFSVYAKDILFVGEIGFGWMKASVGIGSICMMYYLVRKPLRKYVGKKLLGAVFMFGVCIILFAVSTNFYFSIIVLFALGAFDAISMVVRQQILQKETPENLKGRVSAINNIFVSSSNELGAFESGITSHIMGTVPAVVMGGVLTVVVVLIITMLSKSIRNYRVA